MTTEGSPYQELVDLLRKYDSLPDMSEFEHEYVSAQSEHVDRYTPEARELLEQICSMANHELIDDNGAPKYAAMNQLEYEGFRVSPGETDSFGWLSGLINTRNGWIVFG